MDNQTKFPKTRNDKLYGFDEGFYTIPIYQLDEADEQTFADHEATAELQIDDEAIVHLDSKSRADDQPYLIYFKFEGKWLNLTKDMLLNPVNLKLRRMFNEALQKYKVDQDNVTPEQQKRMKRNHDHYKNKAEKQREELKYSSPYYDKKRTIRKGSKTRRTV